MRTWAMILAVGSTVARVPGCADEPVPIAFQYPEGPGAVGYQLRGCEDWQVRAGDTLWVTPGRSPCRVIGIREDGALVARSPAVTLDRWRPGPTVRFDLPTGPLGGIGAEIALEPRIRCLPDRPDTDERCGVVQVARITAVTQRGPAARAGLRPGDTIVSVDRRSSSTLDEVLRRLVGPADTLVRLLVEDSAGDDRRTVTLRRVPAPRHRPTLAEARRLRAVHTPADPNLCWDFVQISTGVKRMIKVDVDGRPCR